MGKKIKTKSILACAVLASVLAGGFGLGMSRAEAAQFKYKIDNGAEQTWDGQADLKGTGAKLEVRGETGAISYKSIYGGYWGYGDDYVAVAKTVIFNGGTVDAVYGGYSANSDLLYNTVNVNDGTVINIYGGYSSEKGVASSTVNITNGVVTNVYGGYVENDNVVSSNNSINVTGGTVNGKIYGGWGNNVDRSTVIISGGNLSGAEVYGYREGAVSHSDNTLQIENDVTIKKIGNFDNINFVLQENIKDNDTMLALGYATNLNGVAVNVYLNGQERAAITLVDKASGSLDNDKVHVYTGKDGKSALTDEYTVTISGNQLILKNTTLVSWYWVGTEEKKFLSKAEAQSISDVNGDVTIYRGAGTDNAYKNVDVGSHKLTVAGGDNVNSIQVTGNLTAGALDVNEGKTFKVNGSADVGQVTLGTGATVVASGVFRANNMFSMGSNNTLGALNTTALGSNAVVSGENSVAIGANSVASEANTVSVGNFEDGGQRRIVNVANGTADNDAATYGQVKNSVSATKADDGTITLHKLGDGATTTNDIVISPSDDNLSLSLSKDKKLSLMSGDTALGTSVDLSGLVGGGTGGITSDEKHNLRWGSAKEASGDYTVRTTAFGFNTVARGEDATAWGHDTQANSDYATAWGYGTIASDIGATVWGNYAIADGYRATAWGYHTKSKGYYTTVWGDKSFALGRASTAFGEESKAGGKNSLAALGGVTGTWETEPKYVDDYVGWSDGTLSTEQGKTGMNAVAIGQGAHAKVDNSVAIGQYAQTGLGTAATGGTDEVINEFAVGGGTSGGKIYYSQITGVANGVNDHDAATYGQIKNAVNILSYDSSTKKISFTTIGDSTTQYLDLSGLGGGGTVDAYTKAETYNKTEVDTELAKKADKTTTLAGYGITDAYTKTETDTELAKKANTADVYAKTETYSKTEVDTELAKKANSADVYTKEQTYSKTEADTTFTTKSYVDSAIEAVSGGIVAPEDKKAAFGTDNEVAKEATAIGHGNKVTGQNSVAVGAGHQIAGKNSGAFGDPTYIDADNSYAIGNNNKISGENSFVLGNKVTVTSKNAVVLGNESADGGENTVSVGSETLQRKIVNVADGENAHDVATYGQLERTAGQLSFQIDRMGTRISKVGAGAAALAAMHPVYDPESKLTFSAGVGNYKSETAAAVGLFYRFDDRVMLNFGASVGNDNDMYNMGLNFALGRHTPKGMPTRQVMYQQLISLQTLLNEQKAENAAMHNENSTMRELLLKQSAENAAIKEQIDAQKAQHDAQIAQLLAMIEELKNR